MIKMIVCSFHNVLINKEEAIPATTMLEIERLRNKKTLFVIATNGLYDEVLEYNKDFPFIDYIISLNGSCIYDVQNNKEIYKKKITVSNLTKISNILDDIPYSYYTNNKKYRSTKETEEDIYKIEILLSKIKDTAILEELEKLKVNTSILKRGNRKYFEITSHHANMFNGADQIALKNNLSLSELLVVAGNGSDYSLVKNIKNSYIVENCDSSLKKLKAKTTTSNNELGVEKILKQVKS